MTAKHPKVSQRDCPVCIAAKKERVRTARDAAQRSDAVTAAASPSSKALIRRRVWVVLNPEAEMAVQAAFSDLDDAKDEAMAWGGIDEPLPVVAGWIEYRKPRERGRRG